ncbi:uncharacterized protein LOC123259003 [Cotesia glomerata]|uniref:uncharacterized protein LOC123259003 n=1 Tax=Cotesia glomerata TaxID=32391 RepID=UPI001D033DB5|nr:uncharacterized protein LOC123259003 [Cotesia glomerata]
MSGEALKRKRTVIKTRMTTLQTALSNEKIDNIEASLRLDRLTELFKEYDDLTDELSVTEPDNEELIQAEEVRNRYYAIASKIKTLNPPGGSGDHSQMNSSRFNDSTMTERQKLVKLPTTELPKFNGNFENWLSFKNTFVSMIDKRTDIDDLNKFLYLRGSLTGAAADLLNFFDTSAENYKRAWELLTETYEKKRALIAKHYDAIIDCPNMTNPTSQNINKFVSCLRQNTATLDSLAALKSGGVMVRLFEKKLPTELRKKWEETLSNDEFPTVDNFCKFLTDYSFKASTLNQFTFHDKHHSSKRRHSERQGNTNKFQKTETEVKSFMTTHSTKCSCCGNDHPLYKCPTFQAFSIDKRLAFVKAKGLCRNCLRIHKEPCRSNTRCKTCKKFHHTLLHIKSFSTSQSSTQHPPRGHAANSTTTSKPESVEKETAA